MDTAARQFEKKWLAAMIAIGPLPGAPRYDRDDAGIIDRALSDLEIYCDLGVDVLVLEQQLRSAVHQAAAACCCVADDGCDRRRDPQAF